MAPICSMPAKTLHSSGASSPLKAVLFYSARHHHFDQPLLITALRGTLKHMLHRGTWLSIAVSSSPFIPLVQAHRRGDTIIPRGFGRFVRNKVIDLRERLELVTYRLFSLYSFLLYGKQSRQGQGTLLLCT